MVYEYVLGRRELRLMTRSERYKHFHPPRSMRVYAFGYVPSRGPQLERRRFNPTKFLPICRQINAEAALIPIQVNEFIYDTPANFHRFVDKLSANQRSSIKQLRMDCEAFQTAFEALNEF